jgi:hypothetical protein
MLIAFGLCMLLADAYRPVLPEVTGIALIALGATLAVVWRFRRSPALPAVIVAHLLVYLSLYLLLVGAILHAAFAKSTGGLSLLQSLDLAMSGGPIVGAVRIAIDSLAGRRDSPAQ